MGISMSKLLQKQKIDVLMLGLKNAGKTTLLYKLLEKEQRQRIPTFGFNMEVLSFADIDLDVMDVGGDEKIVPLWKHYQLEAGALIYVIDDDITQMDKNRELLSNMLSWPERKSIPLLIIYNKTGRSRTRVLYVEDIIEKLDLQKTCKYRKYKVQFVAYDSYFGLDEAITWLCSTLGSSFAAKKLKKLMAKQAKKSRKSRYKKRRKKRDRNLFPSVLPSDRENEQMVKVLNVRPIHPSLGSQIHSHIKSKSRSSKSKMTTKGGIDRKSIVYKDSFGKIDTFFKYQEEKRIEPRVRFVSNRNSVSEDAPSLIDTISSDPFSPISPRRHGTMVRLNEFMERRRNLSKNSKHNTKTIEPLTPSKLTKVFKFFQPKQFPLDAENASNSDVNNKKLTIATNTSKHGNLSDADHIDINNKVKSSSRNLATKISEQLEKEVHYLNGSKQPDNTNFIQNNTLNESHLPKVEMGISKANAPETVFIGTAPETTKSQPETVTASQVLNSSSFTHRDDMTEQKQQYPPRKISQHDIHVNTLLLNRVPGGTKNEQRSSERNKPKKKENDQAVVPKKKTSSRNRRKRRKPNSMSNSGEFLNTPSPNLSPVSPARVSVQTIIAALRLKGKRDIESVDKATQSTSTNLQVANSIDSSNDMIKMESPSKTYNLFDDHSKNFSIGESFA